MTKIRLDVAMVERGLAPSREKARARIMAGEVRINGVPATKAGQEVQEEAEITVTGDAIPFVSRGGLKLDKAVRVFPISLNGRVCVDIGASTGGFTDCLLQKGAKKVYAIDSGKDQLHQKLRLDSRVVSMESFNARYLKESDIGEKCDIVTMDVSFISQTMLYEAVTNVLKIGGLYISLIKPQFEVGKSNIGKNGIVKDEKTRSEVCKKICEISKLVGLENIKIIDSPILGGDGNKEYLALFRYVGKCEE